MNKRTIPVHHDPRIMQKTLVNPMVCEGVGVHSGANVRMKILPASENSGIVFERTDVTAKQDSQVKAIWSAVSATELCTQISNEAGTSVATIEHLMAALAALEIDNVLIQIDGPEVPVMDGSSEPFINLLLKAGIHEQHQPRRTLKILKEVTIEGTQGRKVSLSPADKFSLEFHMDFAGREGLGAQTFRFSGVMTRMREEISRARTFGFLEDVEKMRAAGFAKGGSLDNAVVIDQGQVLNEGGLRYPDEFVRHKILDAIGDLYLAGGPIRGFYQAYNGGHMLNNKLLRALMADPTAWAWEEVTHKTNGYWQPLNNDLFEPLLSFG